MQVHLDLRTWMHRAPFWTGEYEPAALNRLCAALRPGDVVLDVGANIGFYALSLAQRLRALGAGQVFAFEPVRANFDALNQHVEGNELCGYVEAVNVALGREEGEIVMYTGKHHYAEQVNAVMLTGTVQEYLDITFGPDAQRTESVRMTTLDFAACELLIERCDLIKVDIEGAEIDFLRGGENFIRRNQPIIVGEFNPVWMEQFGRSVDDVFSLAREWDYTLYAHMGRGSYRRVACSEDSQGENLVMIPAGADRDRVESLGIRS
jgi:FkbM family methyltransferase